MYCPASVRKTNHQSLTKSQSLSSLTFLTSLSNSDLNVFVAGHQVVVFHFKVLTRRKQLDRWDADDQELPLFALCLEAFVYLHANTVDSFANNFDDSKDLAFEIGRVVHDVKVRMTHPGLQVDWSDNFHSISEHYYLFNQPGATHVCMYVLKSPYNNTLPLCPHKEIKSTHTHIVAWPEYSMQKKT